MLHHPNIDPVFLRLGPIQLHWYGLMYLIAFVVGYFVMKAQVVARKLPLSTDDVADFVLYLCAGVLLGGRIGYILFYNPVLYFTHPMELVAIWHGGMSFHGGMLGTIVGGWLYCRKKGLSFLEMADAAIVAVPIGLGLGRLGNFINGELWGRPASPGLPWAMTFPTAPDRGTIPRHPSPLYELALEGIVLFLVLLAVSRQTTPKGTTFWSFIAGYGVIRFFLEFFRQPDPQFVHPGDPMGLVLGPFSMGQLLSMPMIAIGVAMIAWGYWKQRERGAIAPEAAPST